MSAFSLPAVAQIGWNQDNAHFKPASAHESGIEVFLKPAAFETQPLFDQGRFPNITVALDGSVLAAFGQVDIRRSEDGGKTWSAATRIAKGFSISGLTVDEISGDVLAFMEDAHPPAPLHLYRSKDHGKTWEAQDFTLHPNSFGHTPAMHMNDKGITLRHGRFKGRLLVPSRWYGRTNYPREFFHTHYTNAIFSDDGGRTWKASEPIPIMGCGEASIAELADGSLLYNTRRHWAPTKEESLWRWHARSTDGGQNWENPVRSTVLPDGNTDSTYGLMGSLARLPILKRDLLLFSNVVSDKGRKNGHVWISFDGGKSWPLRRGVFEGSFAYSSITVGRPGTPSEGWIHLLYEGGPGGAGTVARFNLRWLLDGEKTGDGEVPAEFTQPD
ncbi:MAG: glycoside hydrolase [Akkermansiaceae bacterium]|nr:glycoside hydrolase [Akkermansiaceae bacterium]